MTPRQQRMVFVAVILIGVGVATALALTAIGKNMMYFYSPAQVKAGEAPTARNIRVGGLVVEDSVARPGEGLTVHFALTDTAEQIEVRYTGILPDLFREGQGIVAIGQLTDEGVIRAEEVLAKHDENYMPPEVADAIKSAKKSGQTIDNPHAKPGS